MSTYVNFGGPPAQSSTCDAEESIDHPPVIAKASRVRQRMHTHKVSILLPKSVTLSWKRVLGHGFVRMCVLHVPTAMELF